MFYLTFLYHYVVGATLVGLSLWGIHRINADILNEHGKLLWIFLGGMTLFATVHGIWIGILLF